MLVTDSLHDPRLSDVLNNGAVGVLPTDTLYGLVCLASNRTAVQRLYAIKCREQKPGTVIAASVEQLVGLGIPKRYLTVVKQYWPHPISIVVPTAPALAYLDLGKMSLAVRIPEAIEITTLLQRVGPLLTSSANMPSEPPATSMEEARSYFGEKVDFYVDGGDLSSREPSTIIRVVDDAVEVLREGTIKINEKGEIVDDI
jgi:L-threonylcarbamoyladenylate synthase